MSDKKLYQFNLKDNTVKEVPSMEKPDRNDYMRGGQSIMDSRQRSNFLKDEGLYELHLASLNPDPIKVDSPLSSWKDGQILEEGKDIVVMRCCANSCDGFKCKSGNVHLIAYPAADSVANTKEEKTGIEKINSIFDSLSGSNWFENNLLYSLVKNEDTLYAAKALFREGYWACEKRQPATQQTAPNSDSVSTDVKPEMARSNSFILSAWGNNYTSYIAKLNEENKKLKAELRLAYDRINNFQSQQNK